MDLKNKRENVKEYLKEFYNCIPKKTSIFNRTLNIDISKLDNIKEKIGTFYEREILISPMSINKDSISTYIDTLNAIKQFPSHLKPDMIIENNILLKTQKQSTTRRILIPSIIDENSTLSQDYDKMVAYYLALGGDNPVERFSKVGISMKQYGISTDIGISIMKYGNEITSKLEELASGKTKSPKEWECFKEQVLHSFFIAEKIGNRNVNPQEHLQWEERLIKLGILERRIDKGQKQKISFNEELKNMAHNQHSRDDSPNAEKVQIETAIQKNAEQIYVRTGMVPMGYKKDGNGKIVKIDSRIALDNRKNRLSASRDGLSASQPKNQQLNIR